MKTCVSCRQQKSLDEFAQDLRATDKKRSRCKVCINAAAITQERAYEQYAQKSTEGRRCIQCGEWKPLVEFRCTRKRCKACQSERVNRGRDLFRAKTGKAYSTWSRGKTLIQYLKSLLHQAQCRSRRLGRDYDLTIEYLIALYKRQLGKCALSNREMTHVVGEGRVAENISIDRIDNNLGYVPGNIQLVCCAANQAKSSLTQAEFIAFCCDIADCHRKEL
jgi:hypothetical protein